MSFESLSGLVSEAEHTSIFDAVIDEDVRDRQVTREESFASMRKLYAAMKAADAAYVPEERSASGLVGGDGARFAGYAAAGDTLCGDFMAQVIARALRMGECNACMKRIVAAPTAGSCGVLPAVLVPLQLRMALSDDDMIRALFVAGGVGQVIAHRAFIAGAAGGCQAEVGTAAAMAAAALTYLRGGDAQACAHASAMALKNLMGLVCDPVAGLVEVPCVKRNVIGAACALTSADMALAGVRSAIPPDEVIDAMREVGERMDVTLRETGEGVVAATPFARAFAERMRDQEKT